MMSNTQKAMHDMQQLHKYTDDKTLTTACTHMLQLCFQASRASIGEGNHAAVRSAAMKSVLRM